ncbi:geranylgeranylglycerol-phosphate geranylgeranyltransferase [Thermoflavifilum thermophilum]|uniref:4-hydroxybenzoate polyprenyltransferase n=1 Tax=Thermoflavifilum thermophilum TaxID=1393122 RepID=A0A1I7NLU4_9BACT|nr:geranylgeranylglycerol-phosphate geranylgeranyltransferase [Thermoflavifilum thermophilum]SFV35570.1 4-hydroxybenzoate polyprenyltransferase [Thermoflavifilum thermophilum]
MQKIQNWKYFFRLIRYPNLLYIIGAQYLLRYALMKPVFQHAGLDFSLSDAGFAWLVFSTICIAAAGYIINDYFDLNIDQINKPGKVIIDRYIHRRWALAWHSILNLTGLIIAIYLSWHLHSWWMWLCQAICTILLWFYSTHFKRLPLVGNLIISGLTSFTLIVLIIYEPQFYNFPQAKMLWSLNRLIWLYAIFAFLLSMVREIVKDLEDLFGDSKEGCRTAPIVWGIQVSKIMAVSILIVFELLMIYCISQAFRFQWVMAGVYLILLVWFPVLLIMFYLIRAIAVRNYHVVSQFIKGVMLTGIISMAVLYLYL